MVSGEGRGKKKTEIRRHSAVSFRYEFITDLKFRKDSQNVNRFLCGSIFTGIRQVLGV